MSRSLLALAAVAALLPSCPASAAVSAPYTACTSLVGVCPIGCESDSMVQVTVIGAGYGEARCGSGVAYCYSSITCSRQQYLDSGGSWVRCLADPAALTPVVAICSTSPFIN